MNLVDEEDYGLHSREWIAISAQAPLLSVEQMAQRRKTVLRSYASELLRIKEELNNLLFENQRVAKEIKDIEKSIRSVKRDRRKQEKLGQRRREKLQELTEAHGTKRQLVERHALVSKIQMPLRQLLEHPQKAVELFAQWAGIETSRVLPPGPGDPLQVVRKFTFTLLDLEEHSASLLLGLSSEGRYTVVECKPALADLEPLVAKLNETRQLANFFQAIRGRFKVVLSQRSEKAAALARF